MSELIDDTLVSERMGDALAAVRQDEGLDAIRHIDLLAGALLDVRDILRDPLPLLTAYAKSWMEDQISNARREAEREAEKQIAALRESAVKELELLRAERNAAQDQAMAAEKDVWSAWAEMTPRGLIYALPEVTPLDVVPSRNFTLIVPARGEWPAKRFVLQPDITQFELARLWQMLTAAALTIEQYDFHWFIQEHGLSRHFKEVSP